MSDSASSRLDMRGVPLSIGELLQLEALLERFREMPPVELDEHIHDCCFALDRLFQQAKRDWLDR